MQLRQADAADRFGQALEVGFEQRADIGADGGGRGALELADLGQDVGGQEHLHVGQGGAQQLAHALLVRGVEEREQEADGDRLRARGPDLFDQRGDFAFVERGDHVALRIHPLGDLEAAFARDDDRGGVLLEVVEVDAHRAAQLQHVAVAAGPDEGAVGALLLEQGVGDDGGRVAEQRHGVGADPLPLEPLGEAGQHAFREIQRGRGHLGDADASGLFLDHRDVREGAADVHSDAPGHVCLLVLVMGQPARAMARGASPASPRSESGPTSFSTSGITSAPKRSREAAAMRIGMSPNWKKQL